MNIRIATDNILLKNRILKIINGNVGLSPCEEVDVLVIEKKPFASEFYSSRVRACIFKGEDFSIIHNFKNLENAISCGMSSFDTVTFSSIGDSSSVVSVRRTININGKIISPCEFCAEYDNTMPIFQNIVLSLMSYIS